MDDIIGDRESVLAWANAFMASRQPDFIIGDNQVLRWFVIPRNGISNVYLHRFLKSDEDRAPHDHPFDNTLWILSGEYLEHCYHGAEPQIFSRLEGSRIERKAEATHRIELVTGPVTTLFITGPRRREWGFWCGSRWVHWQDFVDNHDHGLIGRGCAE